MQHIDLKWHIIIKHEIQWKSTIIDILSTTPNIDMKADIILLLGVYIFK